MILHDVVQGSDAWKKLRLGIPTSSNFSKILTYKTRKYSDSAKHYIHELVAEHILGEPLDDVKSPFMERGTKLEPAAADWYAYDHDVEVEEVGLVTNDDGTVGSSPDRLVGTDGVLEIKCPAPKGHVENLLGGEIATAEQVQGQLWICEREWADTLSYNPAFPQAVVRVWRDESYIKALAEAMEKFKTDLDHAKRHLTILGERGRREDTRNSLLTKLRASLQSDAGEEAGEPLTLDEIEIVRDQLYLGIRAGAVDQEFADVLRLLIVEGKWARARERWSELQRRMSIQEAS